MATKVFKRATGAPSKTDKYFINHEKGGYATAIAIDKTTGYTLPNCVGWAHGRYRMLNGDTKVWSNTGNWLAGNAGTFYIMAKAHGMKVGSTPKLGAIICWSKVNAAGHVAVVEKILANGDIITSNSAYGSTLWYEQTLTKASGYICGNGYKLEGFVYPDYDFVEEQPKTVKTTAIALNKTTATTYVNETVTLKATLTPSNSTETVTWKSSDKTIATVSSTGKVKGIKKGTVTITATSGTKKVTCKITVKAARYDTYTVVRGDNLWSICQRKYGSNVSARIKEVIELNKLSSDVINIGQVLKLPKA